MRAVKIFGIRNCDTMKKARAWLATHDVACTFHDYKTAGIDAERLHRWIGEVGWDKLLNRAGSTFRKLPEAEREVVDAPGALALMLAQPSMIRRPVLEADGRLLVGFDPATYAALLKP